MNKLTLTTNAADARDHADDWAQAAFDAMKADKDRLFTLIDAGDDNDDARIATLSKIYRYAVAYNNSAAQVQVAVEAANRSLGNGLESAAYAILDLGEKVEAFKTARGEYEIKVVLYG